MRVFVQKPQASSNTISAKPATSLGSQLGQSHAAKPIQLLEANAAAAKRETTIGRVVAGFDFSKIPLHAPALAPSRPQMKLTANAPGDIYEREADLFAGQVVRMSGPASRYPLAGSDAKPAAANNGRAPVQTKSVPAAHSGGAAAPPIVQDVLQSSGQPLDAATRAFMEPRFGHDFRHVRVHADAQATEAASAINARAFTVNRDIVFGAGEYRPQTDSGRRLLSHELTHVLQQNAGARSLDGHPTKVGVAENAGHTLQREEKQPDQKAADPPGHIDYRTAFQNNFEKLSILDNLKQPIVVSLAQGYLDSLAPGHLASPAQGHSSRPINVTEALKPVITTLPLLDPDPVPSYSDVYNAIYDVLNITKVKGGKATDWELGDVATRHKTRQEQAADVVEWEIKDYFDPVGHAEEAAEKQLKKLTVVLSLIYGEGNLVGLLELVSGVGEVLLAAQTVWSLLELDRTLNEPAELSPAAQGRARIILGVKKWLSGEKEAAEREDERKKGFGPPHFQAPSWPKDAASGPK
jgi:Domain of unknown function (DUF4157)